MTSLHRSSLEHIQQVDALMNIVSAKQDQLMEDWKKLEGETLASIQETLRKMDENLAQVSRSFKDSLRIQEMGLVVLQGAISDIVNTRVSFAALVHCSFTSH